MMMLQRSTVVALWSAVALLVGPSPAVAGRSDRAFTFLRQPLGGGEPHICSCDCCQAAERLPSEVEAVSRGQAATGFKCIVPEDNNKDDCPATCNDETPEGNMDPSQSMGASNMDLRRFCMNRCAADVPAPGTKCSYREPVVGPDGLKPQQPGALAAPGAPGAPGAPAAPGAPGAPAAAPPGSPEAVAAAAAEGAAEEASTPANVPEWKKEMEQAKAAAAAAEEQQDKAIAVQRHVTWDMRKLVVERLRAEAGAESSHAAATGERVRLNAELVKRNGNAIKKVAEAVAPLEASIDESKTKAKEEEDKAKAAAEEAKKLFNGAKKAVAPMMAKVKDTVIEKIKADAAEAAKEEAEAYAARMGWSEPDNWRRVLSNRAADPYLKAMSVASARVTEYKKYAEGLIGQAKDAQAKAESIAPHATASEAQGDMISAVKMRNDIKGLLKKSKDLQAEAKGWWKKAEDADKTMRQWQKVSVEASAYVAQEYDIGRTPPKE